MGRALEPVEFMKGNEAVDVHKRNGHLLGVKKARMFKFVVYCCVQRDMSQKGKDVRLYTNVAPRCIHVLYIELSNPSTLSSPDSLPAQNPF